MYPRVKKSTAGRAYMALSSKEPFWVFIALSSFKAHFGKADRVLVNLEVAQGLEKSFTALDRGNAVHDADMKVIDPILQDGRNCTDIRVSANISPDLGTRMLAKLGLALGYKLFERPSFRPTTRPICGGVSGKRMRLSAGRSRCAARVSSETVK